MYLSAKETIRKLITNVTLKTVLKKTLSLSWVAIIITCWFCLEKDTSDT